MSFILVIAAIAAIVWTMVFFRRGSLVDGCLALLIVGYCFGHYFLQFQIGPLPLTLDRVLLAVLCIGFVVQFASRRVGAKPAVGVDWLLLALVLVLTGSALLPGAGSLDLSEGGAIWRLVAVYMMPLAVYWIVRQSRLSESFVRRIYFALFFLGVYLAITAIAEVNGQWWAVFPWYLSDPALGAHFGRARGPQLAAYSVGLYLTVGLVAAWLLLPRLSRPLRLVVLATYPLFGAAIYCTYTRSAWLAAAGALAVLLAVRLQGAWRHLILTGSLVAVVLVAVTQWDHILGFQRETSASDTRHSVSQRTSFAYVSWRMFQQRPILGYGLGQFYEAKKTFLADRSRDYELESIRGLQHHNTFLSLLTETGMVGLALFLAVLVAWARSAWLLCRSSLASDWVRGFGAMTLALLAAYAASAMFHDLTLSPADQTLLFFAAAVTVGLRPYALGFASGHTSEAAPLGGLAHAGWLTPRPAAASNCCIVWKSFEQA